MENRSSPPPEDDPGSRSHCGLSVLFGEPVSLWTPPGVETRVHELVHVHTTLHDNADGTHPLTEVELCLDPGRLVVVGRSSGKHPVPYLDPAYRSTTVLPSTGQPVLRWDGAEDDMFVSRAHFTLRAAPGGGIVFTNGVPRLGGGIRAPINGTRLVAPVTRNLGAGEEVVIEPGAAAVVRLPNRCVLQIRAG